MLAAHLPNRNARVDLPKGIRYLLHRESRLSHRLVLSKVSSEANSLTLKWSNFLAGATAWSAAASLTGSALRRGSNIKATHDELFEIGFDLLPRGLGKHLGHPRLVHVGEVAERAQSETDVFARVLVIQARTRSPMPTSTMVRMACRST